MPNKKIFLANNVSNGSADKFRRVNGRVWNLERNGSSYIRDSDSKQKYHKKVNNVIISKKTTNNSPIMPILTNHIRVVGEEKFFENDSDWHAFVKGSTYTKEKTNETINYKGLVDVGVLFQEYAFDYVMPINKKISEKMADSSKVDTFDFNFEYNFYDRDYENATRKVSDETNQDNALPNHNLISFLRSSSEKQMDESPISDIVFNNNTTSKNKLKKTLRTFDKGKNDPDRSKKNFDKFLRTT